MPSHLFSSYALSQELANEQTDTEAAPCRSIAISNEEEWIVSGDLTGLLRIWRRGQTSKPIPTSSDMSPPASHAEYQFHHVIKLHPKPIYELLFSQQKAEGEDAEALKPILYSAAGDKVIKKMTLEPFEIQHIFKGHDSVVCSLAENYAKQQLISGSWDGTCKIWNLLDGRCLWTLSGHSHAVCVALLNEEIVVTGSQDKSIRFWAGNQCIQEIPNAHQDIIRSIIVMDTTLITTSNDMTICQWDTNGLCMQRWTGHQSFIYQLAISQNKNAKRFFSASEDGTVGIWDRDSTTNLQMLLHACPVWKVLESKTGDLVTCCEDGIIRIWTEEESHMAPPSLRESQRQNAEMAHQKKNEKSDNLDLENIPDISVLAEKKGTSIGQTIMVKKQNTVYAYSWNGKTWDEIGEVTGKSNQKEYCGDEWFEKGMYDYLFEVEVTPGAPLKVLPYNDDACATTAAEKFCAREKLSKAVIDQIITFIQTHSKTSKSVQPYQSMPNKNATMSELKHFPQLIMKTFEKTNWPALHKKLIDANSNLTDEELYKLSAEDLVILDNLIEKVQNESFVRLQLRSCELELAFDKLAMWPSSIAFPVMDLLRGLVLHQDSTKMFKGPENGLAYITLAVKHFNYDGDKHGLLHLATCRYVANLFKLPTNRNAVTLRTLQILSALSKLTLSADRFTKIAILTVLTNFSISFLHMDMTGKSYGRSIFMQCCQFLKNEVDTDLFYRSLVTLGTLLSSPSVLKQILTAENQIQLISLLPPMNENAPGASHIIEITQELLQLLNC